MSKADMGVRTLIRGIIFDFEGTMSRPGDKGNWNPAVDLLTELKDNYKLCLLFSSHEQKRRGIDQGLVEPVHHTFVGNKTKDMLLNALNAMQLPPEDTMYVGDEVIQDITLANILGMKSAWVRNPEFGYLIPELPHEVPNLVLTDVREVKGAVEKLNKPLTELDVKKYQKKKFWKDM